MSRSPSFKQFANVSVTVIGLCPVAATGLVCDSPQFLVQSLVSTPAVVQVAGVVTDQLSIQLCPSAGVITTLHTVQTCAVVQVATGPFECPAAATGLVCDSPQFLVQSLVSTPAVVQVAGVVTDQLSIQLCPSAGVSTTLQTVHNCAVVQVAAVPGVWPVAGMTTTA